MKIIAEQSIITIHAFSWDHQRIVHISGRALLSVGLISGMHCVIYSVEQENGVRGCYRAGSCWHTFFLHSTVLHSHLPTPSVETEACDTSALFLPLFP